MSSPGAFLGGANERLLPASIPFRYFGAAAVFHVAVWLVLLLGGDDVVQSEGGFGLPLAALHLLTLGVLAMTAIGAALQLLPVATRQPLRAVWPARLIFWLFVPGVVVLALGMASGQELQLGLGAGLSIAGLLIAAALIADNLLRAGEQALVAAHAWGALASLLALLAFGVLLIVDQWSGLLSDQRNVVIVHLGFAAYGFIGLLVLGFSQILLPLFALTPALSQRLGYGALGLALAGLALLLASGLGQAWLLPPAIVLGLAASACHLGAMVQVLRRRMRRRLGLSFKLIYLAWLALPLSLLLALALSLDLGPARGGPLFVALLTLGWMLTFMLATLQRIVPFLASMNSVRPGQPPLLPSALAPEWPTRLSFWAHLAALALVGLGIIAGWGLLVRLGGAAGLVGALAFAWFFTTVVRRMTAKNQAGAG